jgi:hypothetical protein
MRSARQDDGAGMPLYKYIAEEEYARALIDNGEVFARPLSYFRAFEDELVYLRLLSESGEIAEKFECPWCVEITESHRLLGRIARHVRLRPQFDRQGIYSHGVDYRKLALAPGVDWALPERVAFIKPEGWAWQKEHRIVFGRKGAFAVENVELAFEAESFEIAFANADHDPLILHVGDLSRFTELHRF